MQSFVAGQDPFLRQITFEFRVFMICFKAIYICKWFGIKTLLFSSKQEAIQWMISEKGSLRLEAKGNFGRSHIELENTPFTAYVYFPLKLCV